MSNEFHITWGDITPTWDVGIDTAIAATHVTLSRTTTTGDTVVVDTEPIGPYFVEASWDNVCAPWEAAEQALLTRHPEVDVSVAYHRDPATSEACWAEFEAALADEEVEAVAVSGGCA